MSDYKISEDGTITNKHNNRIVKPQINGKGYLRVSIGGHLQFVHRLVANAYVPNPENKPQVNHIDGNKLNNHADNLEWVTNQENRDHAVANGMHLKGEMCPWTKLSRDDVSYIRSHLETKDSELAAQFGRGAARVRSECADQWPGFHPECHCQWFPESDDPEFRHADCLPELLLREPAGHRRPEVYGCH